LRLYPECFYGIGLPIPSPEEQREIVKAVDRKTGHYDRIRAKIEGPIDMLKEYRDALISATVTGKIDVQLEAPH
jgi:type I restriction enzyme S subunit